MKNSDINFEEKINKTKDILEKLSQKDLPLNDSLKLYKDGLKEIEEATKILENAKIEFKTLEVE